MDQRERKAHMHARRDQRQEKDGKHLGIDAFLDLLFCHSHLLQDLKPFLVLIAFGNLLIIHNQHRAQNKDDP